jgi:rubredoxin
MIFIGGVQPKTRDLEGSPRTCPRCGEPRARLRRTDTYISLFFIPLIPISKGEPFVACEGCGHVFDERGERLEALGEGRRPRCPGCGHRLESSFTYCPHCGQRVEGRA